MNLQAFIDMLLKLFNNVKVTKVNKIPKTMPAKEAKKMADEKKYHLKENVTRKINRVFIHVSDTPDSRNVDAAEIKRWHTQDNGWSDIGYHFVIKRDGTLEDGRSINIAGAHAAGHNSDSVGICWVGRNDMAPDQEDTLLGLTRALLIKFGLSSKDVYGHKEVDSSKTCPNLDMDEFRTKL